MDSEGVAVGVDKVGGNPPFRLARLPLLELHTARLQIGKGLAAVIDLQHPTRADARLLVTGGRFGSDPSPACHRTISMACPFGATVSQRGCPGF